MLEAFCPSCGNIEYTLDAVYIATDNNPYVECPLCGVDLLLASRINNKPQQKTSVVFENGDIVRINNRDHVWHDTIAIVRAKKHLHYRLEFNGKLVWIHESCLEPSNDHC